MSEATETNIIALDNHRKWPHLSGDAHCLDCNHTWLAVAPVERDSEWLECPYCRCCRGRFKYNVQMSELQYECPCGSQIFSVDQSNAIYCPYCGREHGKAVDT